MKFADSQRISKNTALFLNQCFSCKAEEQAPRHGRTRSPTIKLLEELICLRADSAERRIRLSGSAHADIWSCCCSQKEISKVFLQFPWKLVQLGASHPSVF